MNITLGIWRQQNLDDKGRMVSYGVEDISPDMSFLEMLDVLNEQLGTKVFGALSDAPVALEVDGYDPPTSKAWSVVAKGRAGAISQVHDLMDTVDLPLFPWQAGEKKRFIRIHPDLITGGRFAVADPDIWRTPLSDVRRASPE